MEFFRLEAVDESYLPQLMTSLKLEQNRFNQELLVEAISRFKTPEVAQEVLVMLDADDAYIRNAAIEILKNINRHCLPVLGSKLSSGDKDTRKFILDVLREIRTPESSELAIQALLDRDENVVQTAVEVLGCHRYPKALPYLTELLHHTSSPWLITSLINTLGQLGDPQTKGQIEEKLEQLEPQSIEKAMAMDTFVLALENLGSLEDLVKILTQYRLSYYLTEENLLRAIQGIVLSHGGQLEEEHLKQIEVLMEKNIYKLDEELTLLTLEAAARLKLTFFLKYIQGLIERFNTPFFQEQLLHITLKFDGLSQVDIERLLASPYPEEKLVALKIIATKEIPGFNHQVMKLCSHPIELVSQEALRVVAYIESYREPELLANLTTSPRGVVSEIALQGIQALGSTELDLFIKALAHPHPGSRKIAAKQLVKEQRHLSLEELEAIYGLAQETKDNGKLEALEVLIKISFQPAFSLIEEVLASDNPQARSDLIGVLGSLEDEDYYRYLETLLNDQEPLIRKNAIIALATRVNRRSFQLLAAVLPYEQSLTNRYTIVANLYRFDYEEAFQLIIEELKEEELLIKLGAINALGLSKDQRAIPHLHKYQFSLQRELKEAAVEALEQLGVGD